ncbi:hypothetical protein NEISUBOT_05047 [Neisseria subflava NJ9703]|uniref:Uncharacterized protein n=1 Tax=Neisseria subflava NJ9703 TaxID=546268 RepID=A0A9W5IPY0_NEISU|nr:hypothetical protein NEISUBOT_05047 [Neisseria subflava NJ9703]
MKLGFTSFANPCRLWAANVILRQETVSMILEVLECAKGFQG